MRHWVMLVLASVLCFFVALVALMVMAQAVLKPH